MAHIFTILHVHFIHMITIRTCKETLFTDIKIDKYYTSKCTYSGSVAHIQVHSASVQVLLLSQ